MTFQQESSIRLEWQPGDKALVFRKDDPRDVARRNEADELILESNDQDDDQLGALENELAELLEKNLRLQAENDRFNLDLETARTALKNAQPLIDFVREQEALLYQGIRDQLDQLSKLVPLLSQRFVYTSNHEERNRQIEVIIDGYCAFIRLNHSLLIALRDSPDTGAVRRSLYARLLELYIRLSARPRYSDLEQDFRYIELDAVLSKQVAGLLVL